MVSGKSLEEQLADLEKRVFGREREESLEQAISRYEQQVSTLNKTAFSSLINVLDYVFPAKQLVNCWRTRKIKRTLNALVGQRAKYDRQLAEQQKAIGRYQLAAERAAATLGQYEIRLSEIEHTAAQRHGDLEEARLLAGKTDSKAYLSISQQLAYLGEDRQAVRKRIREYAALAVEAKAQAEVLEGVQQRATIAAQRLAEAEQRLRVAYAAATALQDAKDERLAQTAKELQHSSQQIARIERHSEQQNQAAEHLALAVHKFPLPPAQALHAGLADAVAENDRKLLGAAHAVAGPTIVIPKNYDVWSGIEEQLPERDILLMVDGVQSCSSVWEEVTRILRCDPDPYRFLQGASIAVPRESLSEVLGALQRELVVPLAAREVRVYAALASIAAIPELGLPKPVERCMARGNLYNLENVHAPDAWQITRGRGSSGAIIDTGVDYTHPELQERFGPEKGYNFIDRSPDPMDDNEHGTHVAGIVAGKTRGVAPETTLYALKVLNRDGFGSMANVIRAMDWIMEYNAAHEQKISSANLSLGTRTPNPIEQRACEELFKSGVAVIAAAGNEMRGPSYPASYPNVISVAAVDRWNRHAHFSNIWHTTDISAPGVLVNSCVPNGKYMEFSGTSMATPHISGIAALTNSLECLLPKVFEERLKARAEKLGQSEDEKQGKYGAGLGRADKMVAQEQRRIAYG